MEPYGEDVPYHSIPHPTPPRAPPLPPRTGHFFTSSSRRAPGGCRAHLHPWFAVAVVLWLAVLSMAGFETWCAWCALSSGDPTPPESSSSPPSKTSCVYLIEETNARTCFILVPVMMVGILLCAGALRAWQNSSG